MALPRADSRLHFLTQNTHKWVENYIAKTWTLSSSHPPWEQRASWTVGLGIEEGNLLVPCSLFKNYWKMVPLQWSPLWTGEFGNASKLQAQVYALGSLIPCRGDTWTCINPSLNPVPQKVNQGSREGSHGLFWGPWEGQSLLLRATLLGDCKCCSVCKQPASHQTVLWVGWVSKGFLYALIIRNGTHQRIWHWISRCLIKHILLPWYRKVPLTQSVAGRKGEDTSV